MNSRIEKVWLIALGGGNAVRFNGMAPKQFSTLWGRPLFTHCLRAFFSLKSLLGAVLVMDHLHECVADGLKTLPLKPLVFSQPGETRFLSFLNGLSALEHTWSIGKNDWIAVHDTARPNIQMDDIQRLLDGVKNQKNGGLLAFPVSDSIKKQDGKLLVGVDRNNVYLAQTPQVYRFSILKKLAQKFQNCENITDEATLFEYAHEPIQLVAGSFSNIKVTHQHDLQWLEKNVHTELV